jgi:hypothetical protein
VAPGGVVGAGVGRVVPVVEEETEEVEEVEVEEAEAGRGETDVP